MCSILAMLLLTQMMSPETIEIINEYLHVQDIHVANGVAYKGAPTQHIICERFHVSEDCQLKCLLFRSYFIKMLVISSIALLQLFELLFLNVGCHIVLSWMLLRMCHISFEVSTPLRFG